MPFLLLISGWFHVTNNDDELFPTTVMFNGGPFGTANEKKHNVGRNAILKCSVNHINDKSTYAWSGIILMMVMVAI